MAITKDDVVEYLKGMTLLEASELVKELEEVFGVSAAAAAAPMMMAAPGGGDAAPAAEEKDSFDVILTAAGGNKIAVMQVSASRKRRIWSTVLRKRSRKAFRRTKPKRSRPSLRKPARRSKSNSSFESRLRDSQCEIAQAMHSASREPGFTTKFVSTRSSC
jgi:hypothetical protein